MFGLGYQELLVVIVFLPLFSMWVFGTILAAYVAEQKGRSPWLWAFLSLFLVSPLLALIALAGLPVRRRRGQSTDEDDSMREDETSTRIRRL